MGVNINQAKKPEMKKIPGIGEVMAERIIKFRKENGNFSKPQDLLNVKGVGKSLFSRVKDKIEFSESDCTKKVIFNPAEYGLEDVQEVHLVGEMNDWNPADKTYSLKKRPDGIWEGNFNIDDGLEYKIMYDSDKWEDKQHIGDSWGENLVLN